VSPTMSDRSSILAEEEEEWGRRRRMLDDAPPSSAEDEDRESVAVMLEAQALDKAMEDRVVARKSSASSLSSVGVGMGATWRARYSGRNRAASIASNRTSIISEDLVEEEEEQELLGVGGGFDDASVRPRNSSTDGEDSSTSSASVPKEDENSHHGTDHLILPLTARLQPPSAPAFRPSFTLPPVPATASRASFDIPPRPHPKIKSKRRPPPLGLLPPVPSSPVNVIAKIAVPIPPRIRKESRNPTPPPLHLRASENSMVTSKKPQSLKYAQTPCQTLFVFPPSPSTTRTPSTMTLTSNLNNIVPFPKAATPRVATFRSHGRTRSFIGLGVPPTPTTACSRVDAKGWFGMEKES
jgi:tyrosine-protein phosphatase MSG5